MDRLRNQFYEMSTEATRERIEEYSRKADLIISFMHTWSGSESDAHLTCYDFESGDEIIIDIPTDKGPAAYAESLYNKSRKLRRSKEVVEILLGKVNMFQQYMEEVTSSLTNMDVYRNVEDILTLREIANELEDDSDLCSMYVTASSPSDVRTNDDDDASAYRSQKRAKKRNKRLKKSSKKSIDTTALHTTSRLVMKNREKRASNKVSVRNSMKGLLA